MQIEIIKSKIHRECESVIIQSYVSMDFEESKTFKPRIIFTDTVTHKFLKQ